jgi:hypothetical protein
VLLLHRSGWVFAECGCVIDCLLLADDAYCVEEGL